MSTGCKPDNAPHSFLIFMDSFSNVTTSTISGDVGVILYFNKERYLIRAPVSRFDLTNESTLSQTNLGQIANSSLCSRV